jgi:hypothetical protein
MTGSIKHLKDTMEEVDDLIGYLQYPWISNDEVEEIKKLVKVKTELEEYKNSLNNSSSCPTTKKQSNVESKVRPNVESKVRPRCCHNAVDYFTLVEEDKPKFPLRSDNYFDYERTFQCYDDFRQAMVISNNKIYLNRLEFRLTRLFQNRTYWHTDYILCLTKMRDNALPLSNDDNIDQIGLLTRFIEQGK